MVTSGKNSEALKVLQKAIVKRVIKSYIWSILFVWRRILSLSSHILLIGKKVGKKLGIDYLSSTVKRLLVRKGKSEEETDKSD